MHGRAPILLGWISVLASWIAIDRKVKQFTISLLAMQALMLGVFSALDLFLFYVCWEAMLIEQARLSQQLWWG